MKYAVMVGGERFRNIFIFPFINIYAICHQKWICVIFICVECMNRIAHMELVTIHLPRFQHLMCERIKIVVSPKEGADDKTATSFHPNTKNKKWYASCPQNSFFSYLWCTIFFSIFSQIFRRGIFHLLRTRCHPYQDHSISIENRTSFKFPLFPYCFFFSLRIAILPFHVYLRNSP